MARDGALRDRAIAMVLVLVAIGLRIGDFGNPVIHIDEQYYLLVGQRMLDGATPYVDVWDRKPVGLFLIYAGAAALPGDDLIGYQALATAAAAATAMLVFSASRALGATRTGAVAAAIAYLVWLPLLGGRGGQAPVFYNLLITAAARLTLRLPTLGDRRSAIALNGLAACLLAGIAIQVKPSAGIEGAMIGLAHIWWLRGAQRAWVGPATLWLIAGVAPTLAAAGVYHALGELDAWWFANFASILLRPGYPPAEIAMRLIGISAQLAPLILCAAIAWRRRGGRAPDERALAFAWLFSAVAGFVAIGTFFDHYALPLVAPLAIAGSIALGRSPRLLVGTLGLALMMFAVERAYVADDRASARAVAAVVARNSGTGCPYVFVGDTATYSLAHACLPTSRAFPNMLAYATEHGATGVDQAAEVRRILAARPPVIVASTRRLAIWNPASVAALQEALARDYRPVFSSPRNRYRTIVFLRRDLRFNR